MMISKFASLEIQILNILICNIMNFQDFDHLYDTVGENIIATIKKLIFGIAPLVVIALPTILTTIAVALSHS